MRPASAPSPASSSPASSFRGPLTLTVLFFGVLNLLAWWWFAADHAEPGAAHVRVRSVSARGEVPRDAAIRVELDQAAIPEAAEAVPSPERLIALEPPVEGAAMWDGRSAIVLRPASPLPRATRFTLVVSDAIGAAAGLRLEGKRRFDFWTEPLRFVGARQLAFGPDLRATVRLEFNDVVARAALSSHLRLLDDEEREVPYEILGAASGSIWSVRTREPVRRLRARIAPGLRGEGGPLGLMSEVDVEVPLTRRLEVTAVTSEAVFREAPELFVHFNHAIDGELAGPLGDWIQVEPAVEHRAISAGRSAVRLVGAFEPGQHYRVTVREGLVGEAGSVLVDTARRSVRVPPRRTGLEILGSGFLLASGQGRFSIESAGVERALIEAHRVLPTNLIHYLLDGRSWHVDRFMRRGEERSVRVAGSPQDLSETAVALRDVIPEGEDVRGLWYVRADGGEGWRTRDSTLLMVTDLGLSAKRSADEVLVWATSLADGVPVGRAHVSLWTDKAQMVAFGYTDADGLVEFSGPFDDSLGTVVFAMAESHGDVSYVDLRRHRRSSPEHDIGGREWLAAGYEAFVFADRGVYRPGDELRLYGLVRDRSVSPPAESFPLEVEIHRPDGEVWRTLPVRLEDDGAIEAAVAIDEASQTGRWTARVRLPGADGDVLGETSYLVEEFAPQRLRVALRVDDEGGEPVARHVAGEKIAVVIRGEHLAGLPASGESARLEWRYHRGEIAAARDRWPGFQIGDSEEELVKASGHFGARTLDANGEARFEVEVPPVESSVPLRLRLEASVLDTSGRRVSGVRSLDVDPAPFYLALRPDRDDASIGQPFSVACAAVRFDGGAMDIDEVEMALERVEWSTVLRRNADGDGYRYESTRHTVEVDRRTLPVEDERATASWRVEEPGHYRVVARHLPTGRRATRAITVSGPGWISSTDLSRPELLEIEVLDRLVRPGDDVRVRVRAPFRGTLLLALETDRVLATRVIEMDGNVVETELPIDASLRGNPWVTASVVRGVDSSARWAPHRAWGVQPLWLDFTPESLVVLLDAPVHAEPGERTLLRARVEDQTGTPRESQVVLALVDEGILAWTDEPVPDPWSFFYGRRALGVELADPYSSIAPEIAVEGDPARAGGGGSGDDGAFRGGDAGRLSPVRARRFRTTAIWLGAQRTDADGVLVAELDIPEFTGELRLVAIAHSDSAFGCARRAVTVRPPLHLEIGMPRFAAPGDRFDAVVDVFNGTGESGRAQVSVATQGPLLEPGQATPELAFASTSRERTLSLERGERDRLRYGLRAANGAGVARIDVSAELGSSQRVESIELPVRPAAPRITELASGSVRAAEPLELEVPDGFLAGTARHRLVVGGSPVLDLAGSLRYLVRYPHGCLEQTTSRIFPQIYLSELSALVDSAVPDGSAPGTLEAFEREHVARHVQDGIARLLLFLDPGGGLASWPGGSTTWTWGTVYATHCLVEAQRAGYEVPEDVLARLLDYLEDRIVDTEDSSQLARAYALWTLAAAERREGLEARVRAMLESDPGGTRLGAEARYLLGGALLALGDRDAARRALGESVPPMTARRDTGGDLRSATREAALLLSVLLDVDPTSPRVDALVSRLRTLRIDGRWGTTQENAFALLALGKYARQRLAQPETWTATVTVGEAEPELVAAGESRVFEGDFSGRVVRIDVEGAGAASWFLASEGVPRDGQVREEDAGLAVRRRWLRPDGTAVEDGILVAGEAIEVEITISASREVSNVLVADLLPAGLEVESPRLTRGAPREGEATALSVDHIDVRDDRVLLYIPSVGSRAARWVYAARAVTAGDFVVPVVAAECLYDEGVYSRHGGGRLTVLREAPMPPAPDEELPLDLGLPDAGAGTDTDTERDDASTPASTER